MASERCYTFTADIQTSTTIHVTANVLYAEFEDILICLSINLFTLMLLIPDTSPCYKTDNALKGASGNTTREDLFEAESCMTAHRYPFNTSQVTIFRNVTLKTNFDRIQHLICVLTNTPSKVSYRHVDSSQNMGPATIQQFSEYWCLPTSVALAYVALFVPPQVAFADGGVHSGLRWVAISMDAVRHSAMGRVLQRANIQLVYLLISSGVQVFLVDMIVRLVLPFQDNRSSIKKPYNIVITYVRTWFFIDLLSIFPFELFLSGIHPEYASGNPNCMQECIAAE